MDGASPTRPTHSTTHARYYAKQLKDRYIKWFPDEAAGAGDAGEADEDAKHGAQHDGRSERLPLHHQTSTMGRERDATGRKKQPLTAQARPRAFTLNPKP